MDNYALANNLWCTDNRGEFCILTFFQGYSNLASVRYPQYDRTNTINPAFLRPLWIQRWDMVTDAAGEVLMAENCDGSEMHLRIGFIEMERSSGSRLNGTYEKGEFAGYLTLEELAEDWKFLTDD